MENTVAVKGLKSCVTCMTSTAETGEADWTALHI